MKKYICIWGILIFSGTASLKAQGIFKGGKGDGYASAHLQLKEEMLNSIEEIEDLSLSVYPNPAKDTDMIHIGIDKQETGDFTISRIDGQTMLAQDNIRFPYSFPGSAIPSGLYILSVRVGSTNETVKFIIQ